MQWGAHTIELRVVIPEGVRAHKNAIVHRPHPGGNAFYLLLRIAILPHNSIPMSH